MKKKLHYLIFVLIFFFPSQKLFAQGVWTKKSNVGVVPRASATSFNIGKKGYVCTGYFYDTSGNYLFNDLWEYDPDSNKWTQRANFPGLSRYGAVAFSIGNKGYVGTGISAPGVFYKDFWEYNPDSNKWTRKADFAGVGRSYSSAFSIGNRGYMGTGTDGINYFYDFWEFNPDSNRWAQKTNYGGGPRSGGVGFNIGARGYMGTGYSGTIRKKDFWEYNPDSNKWTQKADVGDFPRRTSVAFVIGNIGYVCLGAYGSYLNDFLGYDPTTNVWLKKADFQYNSRFSPIGFSLGMKGYLGTGIDTNYQYFYNDFWEYDPNNNGVEETEEPNEFSFYPNPSAGNIFIQSSSPIFHCEITDVSGRLVYQASPQQNKNLLEINLSVPDGIYFIKIITQDGIGNRKVVVRN